MRRRCSELYFSGEYLYAEVRAGEGGLHEVKLVARDGRVCRLSYRRGKRGEAEVVSDESAEQL